MICEQTVNRLLLTNEQKGVKMCKNFVAAVNGYMNRKRWLILLSILVIGVAVIVFHLNFGDVKASDLGKTEEYLYSVNAHLKDFGVFRYMALLIIQLAQVVIAIIPGEFVELLSGFALGTLWGTVLCIVGSALGAAIIYWGVHRFGKRFIAFFTGRKFYERMKFLKDPVRRDMFLFILFFIPGTPKDLLLYFSPLLDIKLSRLLMIVSIARIPSLVSSCYVGAHVAEGMFGHSIVVFAITGMIGLAGILINDMILQYKEKKSKDA